MFHYFYLFPSTIILFINSYCNFNLNFSCLVGVDFAVCFGVGSPVGILSNFFIGNNLLLKLLKTFSLELSNNPKLLTYFVTFLKIL